MLTPSSVSVCETGAIQLQVAPGRALAVENRCWSCCTPQGVVERAIQARRPINSSSVSNAVLSNGFCILRLDCIRKGAYEKCREDGLSKQTHFPFLERRSAFLEWTRLHRASQTQFTHRAYYSRELP